MDYRDGLSEIDVRLLNALDEKFNKLLELSGNICKLLSEGEKDMEFILHSTLSPNESQLSQVAYELYNRLSQFKSRQYQGGNDAGFQASLMAELMKIQDHHDNLQERLDNTLFIVEEEDDYDTHSVVYFHGTDARMVEMSDAERSEYKEACIKAIDYLWQFFEPYYTKDVMIKVLKEPLDYYEDDTLYANLQDALARNNARIQDNQLYQYDCFYLTNLKGRAKQYAFKSFAGGEMGLTAYRMYQAAQKLEFQNWNPSEVVEKALKKISEFATTPARPVIFTFNNLNMDYLQNEDGSDVSMNKTWLPQNARYIQKITLDINNAIPVVVKKRIDILREKKK